eukprot:12910923-Heterocapsa_arctica.AAC.1
MKIQGTTRKLDVCTIVGDKRTSIEGIRVYNINGVDATTPMTASWWMEDGRRDEQRGRRGELHLREGEHDEEYRLDQLWQDDVCEAAVARVRPVAGAASTAGSYPAVLGVADSNPTPPRRGRR